MKHQYLFKVIGLTVCLGTDVARAQYYETSYHDSKGVGPYARFDLGPSFFRNGELNQFGAPGSAPVDYNVGFAGDMAFGYAFNKYIASDFEFGTITAGINSVPGFFSNDSYLSNVPFLANVSLSYPIPRTLIVPYIGGGIGGSWSSFNTDGFGNGAVTVFGYESDVVLAWQAFAGVRVKLNNKMSLGLGYKYFATEDSSFVFPPASFPGSNFTVGFKGVRTHSVLISLQMSFW